MTLTQTALLALGLLLTPGPTNSLGALLRQGKTGLPGTWRRAAAVWLGVLSAYLASRVALA